MFIRIIKSTVCSGRNVTVGDELDAELRDAKILIRMGKAVKIERPKTEVPAPKKKVAKSKTKSKSKSFLEE